MDNNYLKEGGKSFVLCRTPFQASICLRLVESNYLKNFDMVYVSFHDSSEDRLYFDMLSKKARSGHYVCLKKGSIKFIVKAIKVLLWSLLKSRGEKYDKIYASYIASWLFRIVQSKNKSAEIFGFDDGAGNITLSSVFHKNKADGVFEKAVEIILGLSSVGVLKSKIKHHYTVYHGFKNVVDDDRLILIPLNGGWSEKEAYADDVCTFFIGQPFSEYLNEEQMKRLSDAVRRENIDFYVIHPREVHPLLDGVPILDKGGLLAEDAILKELNGRRAVIFAAYSTVLFNIPSGGAEKIYFSIVGSAKEDERLEMISKTGAKIVIL